jgi:hypothetical protein
MTGKIKKERSKLTQSKKDKFNKRKEIETENEVRKKERKKTSHK